MKLTAQYKDMSNTCLLKTKLLNKGLNHKRIKILTFVNVSKFLIEKNLGYLPYFIISKEKKS